MATYEELECHTLREAIPPIARADIAILLLELCQVETDHLWIDWDLMTPAIVERIITIIPSYSGVKNNLKTYHLLCSLVAQEPRVRAEAQEARIAAVIEAKDENWKNALQRYRTDPNAAAVGPEGHVKCWIQFLTVGREILSFAMQKIKKSIAICQTFIKSKELINKLVDHGNKLRLGYIDVAEAYELGRGIQGSIDKTQDAIKSYFGIPFPFDTDDCLPALRAFVSSEADVIDVGLEGFLAAAATQTLHKVFISTVNDPDNYSELSKYRTDLSKFLSTVGSHKPDESTLVKNRLSKKLEFAKS